tara:strand:- start:191 stop:325 length:135 start_codon:yes stop_codon:yes gene_type:complete
MGKFFRVFLLIFFLAILSSIIMIMYIGVPPTFYTVEKVIENDRL